MNKWRLIALGLIIGALGLFSWWQNQQYILVTRVVDGDNVELADGRRVRYIGIDAPEEDECFRQESVKLNEELVLGKKVKLELDQDTMDDYGRMLAYVYVDGQMVNQLLLEQGAGEYFFDQDTVKFADELIAAATRGYEEKRGKWQVCGGEKGCVVKGNLDKLDKRWYHLPGFRHYEQTVVRLDKGDRWFCSEGEAIKAGFEKARE